MVSRLKTGWQRLPALLQGAAKLLIIALMNYGPVGATSWLLRTVSRRPLRLVLAFLLEPLLRHGFHLLFGRFTKEKNETTAK